MVIRAEHIRVFDSFTSTPFFFHEHPRQYLSILPLLQKLQKNSRSLCNTRIFTLRAFFFSFNFREGFCLVSFFYFGLSCFGVDPRGRASSFAAFFTLFFLSIVLLLSASCRLVSLSLLVNYIPNVRTQMEKISRKMADKIVICTRGVAICAVLKYKRWRRAGNDVRSRFFAFLLSPNPVKKNRGWVGGRSTGWCWNQRFG